MATKKTTPKKATLSDTQKIGLGVGLTAAAVAAAGTFFLYGSKGASKNRKAVKSWALKAKAEVLERLEQAKEMSADEYMQLIDTVGGAYAQVKDASKGDIAGFKKEMKEYWNKIEKTAKPAKKAVKKAVAKAEPAVKKAVAKSPVAKKVVAAVKKATK
jgi:hypothetical protein